MPWNIVVPQNPGTRSSRTRIVRRFAEDICQEHDASGACCRLPEGVQFAVSTMRAAQREVRRAPAGPDEVAHSASKSFSRPVVVWLSALLERVFSTCLFVARASPTYNRRARTEVWSARCMLGQLVDSFPCTYGCALPLLLGARAVLTPGRQATGLDSLPAHLALPQGCARDAAMPFPSKGLGYTLNRAQPSAVETSRDLLLPFLVPFLGRYLSKLACPL